MSQDYDEDLDDEESIDPSALTDSVPAWHLEELNRRKVDHAKHPELAVSWEEAKRRILAEYE